MAVRELTSDDKPPRHVGRTAKKVAAAAKGGTLHQLNAKDRKPLRPGQRHRGRAKKARVFTTYSEAPEVEARADKILGAEVWRLRSLVSEKILYLFSSAERINGCMDGIISASRYPKKFRYKTALRYEFLVLVARPRWERATDEDRTRITYHALRHFGMDVNGRQRMDPHDIVGFVSEVEFFGLRSPEIKRIAEQLDLFQHRPLKASEKTAQSADAGGG